jgi:hypothetical protein
MLGFVSAVRPVVSVTDVGHEWGNGGGPQIASWFIFQSCGVKHFRLPWVIFGRAVYRSFVHIFT